MIALTYRVNPLVAIKCFIQFWNVFNHFKPLSPFWVVLKHELLRTPTNSTNSHKLPTFTKTRTPKNNIFCVFLKLLPSCCHVVVKSLLCCCKQLGVRNNNLKHELPYLKIFKKILKILVMKYVHTSKPFRFIQKVQHTLRYSCNSLS